MRLRKEAIRGGTDKIKVAREQIFTPGLLHGWLPRMWCAPSLRHSLRSTVGPIDKALATRERLEPLKASRSGPLGWQQTHTPSVRARSLRRTRRRVLGRHSLHPLSRWCSRRRTRVPPVIQTATGRHDSAARTQESAHLHMAGSSMRRRLRGRTARGGGGGEGGLGIALIGVVVIAMGSLLWLRLRGRGKSSGGGTGRSSGSTPPPVSRAEAGSSVQDRFGAAEGLSAARRAELRVDSDGDLADDFIRADPRPL